MSKSEETQKARKQLPGGTLIRGIGSFYTVRTPEGETFTLRAKKKFRRQKMTPLVGDEVLFVPGEGEEDGWLEEILPRKTVCLRPPVANVSRMVLVLAPVPEADLLLADRLLCRAVAQGMSAVIAVNKTDLDASLPALLESQYAVSGVPVIPVCARTGEGLDRLREALRGETCCMMGQSGAGKSTLLNGLLGLSLETGEISPRIERGRNTTRHVELLTAGGLRIMDTAGFNLLEPEKELEPEKLKERYPEFHPYEGKCRFRECLHDREPDCAVAEAVRKGAIHRERWERYRKLLAETRETWRNRYD